MTIRMLALWHLMLGVPFLWGSCCSGSSISRSASALDGLTALLEGNPDCCDEDGHTMLGKAAAEGRLAALDFLLARGAQPDIPSDGLTPLMWASNNGCTKAIKKLLCAGATIDAHDGQGRTALMMASEQGRIEAVEMLLEARANPNFCRSNWTPLICAVSGGCAVVLEMLLQAGAKVNAVTQRGKSALLCAVQAGHVNLTEALLAAGANPDHLDIDSGTPLTSAASSGALDAVGLLLGAGAKVNFARVDGSSALLLAIQEGHLHAAKALLAAEADPNISSNKGDVPLISALKGRHAGVVKLLLKAGADVDVFDGSGWTPLTYAVHHRMVKPVKCLLEKGANPNRAHLSGDTPLGYAINHWKSHRKDAQDLLLALAKHGARLYEEKYGPYRDSSILQAVPEQNRVGQLAKELLDIVRTRRCGSQQAGYWARKRGWELARKRGWEWERPRNLDEWVDVFEAGRYRQDDMCLYAVKRGWVKAIPLFLKYSGSAGLCCLSNRNPSTLWMKEDSNAYCDFIRRSRTLLMCALHNGQWKTAKVLINLGVSSAIEVACPQRLADLYCVHCTGDSQHLCRSCGSCLGPNSFERAAYTFDVVDDTVALALQEYRAQHWFFGLRWQRPQPGRGFEILRFLAVHNLLTSGQRERLCSLASHATKQETLRRIGPRVICDSQGRYSDWRMNDVQRYTTRLFADISERLKGWYKERYAPFTEHLPRDLVKLVRKFDAVTTELDA